MSFELGCAPDLDDLEQFPKVARQHQLAAGGFRVPPGIVLALAAALDEFVGVRSTSAKAWVLDELGRGGALIARSASRHEDSEQSSGAGLGMSIAGIRDLSELRAAILAITTSTRSGERALLLIQREVPRRALLVMVRGAGPDDAFNYLEVHGPNAGPEPLADGRSPDWAGLSSDWDDPARAAVEQLARSAAASSAGPHGVDLEVVVDPDDVPWLVQSRPLTRPLSPGWARFVAEVEREGQGEQLRGSLILDGEHNPAPLSIAHAWLMRRLSILRPGKSGDPVVLAGWLYVRALPRELARLARPPAGGSVMSAQAALAWLRDQALPNIRASLREFTELLAREPSVRVGLAAAESIFVGMIDDYVDRLVPARSQARAMTMTSTSPSTSTPSSADPLTLRARAEFLDVLPAVWDIASPTLADLLVTAPEPSTDRELPDDPHAAARLLGEWDDHLFACGLAPLRQLWRHAAARLRLDHPDRVFLLDGDELVALDEASTKDAIELPDLDARERRLAARAELDPPARILDGRPVPRPIGGHLRGLAIGESFTGPIAQRRDLRELLLDPPAAGSILCIPALTAQAAVALAQLGIRAVCTEWGGALSHGALMARELGLSALIGCRGCTTIAESTIARLDTRGRRLRYR